MKTCRLRIIPIVASVTFVTINMDDSSFSIVHSCQVPVHVATSSSSSSTKSNSNNNSTNNSNNGVLVVSVRSTIRHAVADEEVFDEEGGQLNDTATESRSNANMNMTTTTATSASIATKVDEESVVLILQTSTMVQPPNSSNNTSISGNTEELVSFEMQYTVQQLLSQVKVGSMSMSMSMNRNTNNTTEKQEVDTHLQKLKYILSLLKDTTSTTLSTQESTTAVAAVPTTTTTTKAVTSNPSSQHFLVLQMIPSTLPETKSHTLQLSIKERLPNTMVRIIWSTTLSCVDSGSTSARNSVTALFDVTRQMIETQQTMQHQLRNAQQLYQSALRARDGWEDTALKLEGQWEKEKATLFQNFCTLYSQKQEHDNTIIDGLRTELNQLQKQKMVKHNPSDPMINTITKHELPDCLQDIPDDHNNVAFDDDTVRRLALGQRVPIKVQSRTTKSKANVNDETDSDIDTTSIMQVQPLSRQSSSQRQVNPISGAIEYMDAEAALQDIATATATVHAIEAPSPSSPLPPPTPPLPPAKIRKTIVQRKKTTDKPVSSVPNTKRKRIDSSQTTTAALPSEKSVAVTTVTTAANKKKQKKDTNTTIQSDQSDTGSESEFVDKSMEAQIMADLEALRKM
jgi:hypothetical protein